MLQSKARLLELNSKLAETLTSKGVTATADETTSALVNKVAHITSGDDSVLKGLIQRNLTEIVIPDGVTVIGKYTFSNWRNLKKIKIPDTVEVINESAFSTCISLENSEGHLIPKSVKKIEKTAFDNCYGLTELILPEGLQSLGWSSFRLCYNIKKLFLPKSLTKIDFTALNRCTGLVEVTLGDGFNCNNLDLSVSTLYTRETILQWLNALADRTGQTAYKLTIGATNLAKLTEEDILIATNKNWTLE